jgi:hypothetical protein
MAERREKGQCFNCDERFSRNHRCKARFLLFIADDDEVQSGFEPGEPSSIDPDPPLELPNPLEEFNPAQLSYDALSGVQSAQTI